MHALVLRSLIDCACTGLGALEADAGASYATDAETPDDNAASEAGEAYYDPGLLYLSRLDRWPREQMIALIMTTDTRMKRERVTDNAIGETVRALRFERSHSRRGNLWVIPVAQVVEVARSYNITALAHIDARYPVAGVEASEDG